MKKQVVQAAGDADQTGNEQNNVAAPGPAFSDLFFFIQIRDGAVNHRFAQGKNRWFSAVRA